MNLNKKIDELKEELISSTQNILKIKSVEAEPLPGMPFGEGVNEALDATLELADQLGFTTINYDGYVGVAEYGSGEDYVGVLGHLDVVPEGEGWTYPPYGAEIHDGKIYARGTLDDKGPIIAALYGLKALADSKIPLSKKVRIIFGTNEESGSAEIKHYLDKEKPPVAGFTPDAQYPMINGEKGLTVFNLVKDFVSWPATGNSIEYIKGGLKANMVPDYAEAKLELQDVFSTLLDLENYSFTTGYKLEGEISGDNLTIKSYGVAAHGSTPELGKNAIMQLLGFLGKIDFGSSDVSRWLDFVNDHIGMDVHGESFGVDLEDEVSGKLSFNVGVIDLTPRKSTLTLNLRYPVTNNFEDMNTPLLETLEGSDIRVENMENDNPLFFPEDHELIKVLQKVYVEQTGLDPKPIAIGGGTYAKEMPNIVAFGPIFPGKPDLDHQVNEYIEIEDLINNAKIYAHAIYELAK